MYQWHCHWHDAKSTIIITCRFLFESNLDSLGMTLNEDAIDASVKTAKTLLLHLGYDPTWVEDKFIPRFDRNLTKLNQNKLKPSRRNW